jgi:hypothetical protein
MSDVGALNLIRSRWEVPEENAFLTRSEVNKVKLSITLKFVGSTKVCLHRKPVPIKMEAEY